MAQTTQLILADQHCNAGGSDTLIAFLTHDISHDATNPSVPWKSAYSDQTVK